MLSDPFVGACEGRDPGHSLTHQQSTRPERARSCEQPFAIERDFHDPRDKRKTYIDVSYEPVKVTTVAESMEEFAEAYLNAVRDFQSDPASAVICD